MRFESYAVVDVETTGFSPLSDRIVEIACVLVDGDEVVGRWATLVNPGIPIPQRATEVHGITDGLVAGAPRLGAALKELRLLRGSRPIVAHSARFDLAFLGWPADMAICTVRLARALIPEAPDHKNQTLRRLLKLDRSLGNLVAHRALDDALVTAQVLITCRRRFNRQHPGEAWSRFLQRNAFVWAPPERRAS